MSDDTTSVTVQQGDPPQDWDRLVCGCPWGSFYHSQCNLTIVKSQSPVEIVFIIARDGGQRLVGGLALAVQEGCLGSVVNCLPYFGSYGDALTLPSTPPEVEGRLYRIALDYCRRINALCLTVITSPFAETAHHQQVRQRLEPAFVDERCCQIVTLPEYSGEGKLAYAEKVLCRIQSRARTAYKQIVRKGFELGMVETEAEAFEFARIHRANIGGKGGIFKTDTFFDLVFRMSRESPTAVEMALVRDGNLIAAGVVLFRFKNIVEYHTTALRDEYRSSAPIKRLVIDKMVENGMAGRRFWNFGGTWKSQTGVHQFKSLFGAEDYPYFYLTRFFRDLERLKALSPEAVIREYPLCYVIPFSELNGNS